ncbi:Coatomer, gamma subunit [Ramicandelaber brevisporus]|nr:Coatomer, gamma subunit [Ramicandelaber brevisporus]
MAPGHRDDDGFDDTAELLRQLDKSNVLQEARVFHATPIQARQCRFILAKVLFLFYQGESLTKSEATELFFAILRLFQTKEPALRQMVYLVIKELSSRSDNTMMATSSLMKDAQQAELGQFRGGAVRALSRILDPSTLPAIERPIRAMFVDKSPQISSSALLAGVHLFPGARDIIRRWANDVNEVLISKPGGSGGVGGSIIGGSFGSYFGGNAGSGASGGSPSNISGNAEINVPLSNMSQYHALGLLYLIKSQDKMAVLKIVQNFSPATSQQSSSGRGFFGGGGSSSGGVNTLRSHHAQCMLIRYAMQVMGDSNDPSVHNQLYNILEGLIRHRSDMVSLEAARAICNMRNVTMKELTPAVSALQLLLTPSKSVLRFSAIRTLNQLASNHPEAVAQCNSDIELLLSDSNSAISALAISTLLKTGNETNVDRLVKQLQNLIGDISEDFKVTIVQAVKSLALQFPNKHGLFLSFLSSMLRGEGDQSCKTAAVDAIVEMVRNNSKCIEPGLAALCELIEDCEYPELTIRALHLLGSLGPHTSHPTMYLRHIYNRVVLDTSSVRAAAVSAMSKFAFIVSDQTLSSSVRVLLNRCLDDSDDEVRDRAAWALASIESDSSLISNNNNQANFALSILERKLFDYCVDPSAFSNASFDSSSVPRISPEQELIERSSRTKQSDMELLGTLSSSSSSSNRQADDASKKSNVSSANAASAGAISGASPAAVAAAASAAAMEAQEDYIKQLKAIPEFGEFASTLFRSSSSPIPLTESETEYSVSVIKHVFVSQSTGVISHVVFQFDVTNTINDQLLENVSVKMDEILQSDEDESEQPIASSLVQFTTININELKCGVPGTIYVGFRNSSLSENVSDIEDPYPLAGYACTLHFTVKDCDPNTGIPDGDEGFEDEYSLESTEVNVSDYVMPTYLGEPPRIWEQIGPDCEIIEEFTLSSFTNLKSAVTSVIEVLGLLPLGEAANPKSEKVHQAQFQGRFAGGAMIMARARMAYSQSQGVTLELAVRSEDETVSQLVVSTIA